MPPFNHRAARRVSTCCKNKWWRFSWAVSRVPISPSTDKNRHFGLTRGPFVGWSIPLCCYWVSVGDFSNEFMVCCVCGCVCVVLHNWAPEIGIVYLHFQSQISGLIFVHYTHARLRNSPFFQIRVPPSHGKSLPNAAYITMWMYVNFLLIALFLQAAVTCVIVRGICSEQGNPECRGWASETKQTTAQMCRWTLVHSVQTFWKKWCM